MSVLVHETKPQRAIARARVRERGERERGERERREGGEREERERRERDRERVKGITKHKGVTYTTLVRHTKVLVPKHVTHVRPTHVC